MQEGRAVDEEGMRRVTAVPITAQAWAPFGWLPVNDTDPVDSTLSYEFQWGDPHVNFIAHTYDEVDHGADGAALCKRMYRHDTHTQTLLAINVESIIAVAPASVEFTGPEDFATIRAFHLRPLDALALFRGTWHWGPFPLGAEPIRLFNVQGKRYAEDNRCVELAPSGGAIEVVTAG
jgi:ureidoglycolate hydrolase